MILIDGKKEAASLRLSLKEEVKELKKKFNNVPGLTVILIGELAPSQIYVRNKEKSAKEVGLNSEIIKYPENVDEITVLKKIKDLNENKLISGILVQLPLPRHIDKKKIIASEIMKLFYKKIHKKMFKKHININKRIKLSIWDKISIFYNFYVRKVHQK